MLALLHHFTTAMFKTPSLQVFVVACLAACAAASAAEPKLQHPLTTAPLDGDMPGRGWGSVPIQEATWFEMGYSLNITFGNPPQQVPVYLDISSPDSWVTPEALPDRHRVCETAPTFNTSASSTFLATSTFARFHFDWLWGQGNLSYDTVSFGSLSVQHQAFAIPDYISSDAWGFNACPMAGIIGLAPFSSRTERDDFGKPSPLVSMALQKALSKNLFALRLHGPRAELSFGRTNPGLYRDGFIAEAPLTRHRSRIWDGGWQTTASHLRLEAWDADNSFVADLGNVPATFSTRSPQIHLPKAVYDSVYAAAGFEQLPGWLMPPTVDCARRFDMPNVTIALGDGMESLTLTAFEYTMVWPLADPGPPQCACLFTTSSGFDWSGEIILGWAFVRAFYVVFDLDEKMIRFATLS
ncbi:aspartic peptidase domain-containing protein [Immersiella caudata]|uniref:Aspartic peptidase domain-containing protein n=1 Tax=Immersiella caudata TaxID=314043 RepID=A0AA39WYZ2_9PEZI|nr:aspartic peptidase domain-containing protein [Immersiella caudata]